MKKGQITAFIIIGIILLAAASFIFLMTGEEADLEKPKKISSDPIENYVQGCIDETAKEAIIMAGVDGGMTVTSSRVAFFGGNTPYYYGTPDARVPDITEVQDYIADYVTQNLENCVDFSVFPGKQITSGKIMAAATISDNSVKLDVDYPLTINEDGSKKQLTGFSTILKSRIKEMHDVANDYIETQAQYPGYMCMSCMVILGTDHEVKFKTHTMGNLVAYEIIDEQVPLDNKPYKYMFAVKYPEEEAQS